MNFPPIVGQRQKALPKSTLMIKRKGPPECEPENVNSCVQAQIFRLKSLTRYIACDNIYCLKHLQLLAAQDAALSPWGVCRNRKPGQGGLTKQYLLSCTYRLAASGAALSSWGVCQNQHSNSCGGYNQSIILSFSHFYQFSFNGCILIVSTFLKVNLRLSQPQKGNFSSATFLQSQDCCFQANGQ